MYILPSPVFSYTIFEIFLLAILPNYGYTSLEGDTMKLWHYINEYKIVAGMGFLFKMLEAACELAVPMIMANIIDVGIKNKDTSYIYYHGMILILLALAGYAFALICQYYASKASQSIATRLREDMYAKVNDLDYRALDTFGGPTLVTRISNDIIQLQLAIALTIRLTSRAPFLIIGSLLLSFLISPCLSMIFVIGAIVLAIVILSLTYFSTTYYTKIQQYLDILSRITRENLEGIRVIRAFSRQKKEKERFHNQTKAQQSMQLKVGRLQALTNPLTYGIVNIAIIIIVYQGGLQVNIGQLGQGQIIALVNYMTRILLALLVFTNVLVAYNRAGACYKRIFAVLNTPTSLGEPSEITTWDDSQPCAIFENVSFRFESEEVLHSISFSLPFGQTLGIIGGTGAGKSTLIQLLGNFYQPQTGSIYIAGNPIEKIPQTLLRKNIAYVPQHATLLSGTIRENLVMGDTSITDATIEWALTVAQASFVYDLPEALQTHINQGGKNISGGQRQRLTIARALLRQPKILILDNSDSALDNVTSVALRTALQTIKDMSIIIVSQRTFALEHASKILVLYHGNQVGYGNHQQLLEQCDVYKEIYDSQQKGASA